MGINKDNDKSVLAAGGKKKVLIFVVCYKAEKSIESVLERIPRNIWENENFYTEILVIDDQSPDQTFYIAENFSRCHPEWNITVLYNPKSQGYGGNQKVGYCYAIQKGFDVVVLLHGDGQYAPEYLDQMVQPILDDQADVVLGSRMIRRLDALKSQMPFYKWLGNGVLTFIQNRILKSKLSEFHSGYRAYSVSALADIPYEHNSNDFDFDTDVIIQLIGMGRRIKEIPIPVFYGSEISKVKGMKYAVCVVRSCLLSRVMRLGIYYHPKFDYEPESNYHYKEKFGYPSSQQYAFDQVKPESTALDIGCGPGFMAKKLASKGVKTTSIDLRIQEETKKNSWKYIEVDVDKYNFDDDFGKIDYVLALDIIEHLKSPERLLRVLRERFSHDAPNVIITTANIAFFPLRIGLLFDSFNYGKRGILDMDHTRLFTFSTLTRTLEINGYEIIEKKGVPAPFPLAVGEGWLASFLLWINRALIFCSKRLFSYQIAIVAKPLPTLEHLLENAHNAKEHKLSEGVQEGSSD
ncbi:MAG: glycosyltransferase [Planctomycetes bacterium]|nr:glycosyltransferase [Planctomycetota bacterium]